MNLYRIKISDYGYVKAIVFDVEPCLRVMPTFEKTEAGVYEEDKAKYYCNTLNYENQGKNIIFSLEKVNKEIVDNNFIELVKENPELPIYAWVNSEVVEDDYHSWLGQFTTTRIREYAKVEEYNCYGMDIVFKDDDEEYFEYLINTDKYKDLSDEEAKKQVEEYISKLEFKKAIFVDVVAPII
ncbi:MAG: hypothetical protein J6K18_06130 [Bacilli bacterium]|nr:hypothetical protein [Bacilli bacterium]